MSRCHFTPTATATVAFAASVFAAALAVGVTTYVETPKPGPSVIRTRSAVLTHHDSPKIAPIPMGPTAPREQAM